MGYALVAQDISIHAPARGATGIWAAADPACRFQFTPPRGGRLGRAGGRAVLCISIHAPARGATFAVAKAFPLVGISIHAPARGATQGADIEADGIFGFQFTPPRGGRLQAPWHRRGAGYFNSRPRAGGDPMSCFARLGSTVFQFTPPRGGRPRQPGSSRMADNFNSRPRAGGDLSRRCAPRRA